jgi:hypothetical protein
MLNANKKRRLRAPDFKANKPFGGVSRATLAVN